MFQHVLARRRPFTPLAVVVFLFPIIAGAQSANPFINNVFTRGADGQGVLIQSTTGTAVHSTHYNSASASSTNRGVASARQSTLKASASLSAYQPLGQSPDNRDVKTTVDFRKRLSVLAAPNSNLNTGDAVLISFRIKFDGLSRLGWNQGPEFVLLPEWNRILVSADVSTRFSVNDLTNQTVGEGGPRPTRIGDFSFGSRIVLDEFDQGSSTGWNWEIREGWSAFGNSSGPQSSPFVNDYESGNASFPFSVRHDTDVGALTFVTQTTVGSELEVTGSLDLFLQAMGLGLTGSVLGDFENTFDAEIIGVTEGAMVLGEEPGEFEPNVESTTAPEPATLVLLSAGLAALAVTSRRRRVTS